MSRKNIIYLSTLVFIFLLSISACSKQDDNQSPASPATAPANNTAPAIETPETGLATEEKTVEDSSPDNVAETTDTQQNTSSTTATATEQATENTSDDQQSQLTLARKSGCLACHAIDKKVVGPAWKDVATSYKDDPGAKDKLIEKVKKGGRGNWTEVVGNAAMPPYSPRVSDANIGLLVDFVLSL